MLLAGFTPFRLGSSPELSAEPIFPRFFLSLTGSRGAGVLEFASRWPPACFLSFGTGFVAVVFYPYGSEVGTFPCFDFLESWVFLKSLFLNLREQVRFEAIAPNYAQVFPQTILQVGLSCSSEFIFHCPRSALPRNIHFFFTRVASIAFFSFFWTLTQNGETSSFFFR